jgi:hypothetical protein
MDMQIACELNPADNRNPNGRWYPLGPSNPNVVAEYMEILTYLLWTQGPMNAHDWYVNVIQNGSFEVAVSHRIEAKAFEGTSWAILFNLLCGE